MVAGPVSPCRPCEPRRTPRPCPSLLVVRTAYKWHSSFPHFPHFPPPCQRPGFGSCLVHAVGTVPLHGYTGSCRLPRASREARGAEIMSIIRPREPHGGKRKEKRDGCMMVVLSNTPKTGQTTLYVLRPPVLVNMWVVSCSGHILSGVGGWLSNFKLVTDRSRSMPPSPPALSLLLSPSSPSSPPLPSPPSASRHRDRRGRPVRGGPQRPRQHRAQRGGSAACQAPPGHPPHQPRAPETINDDPQAPAALRRTGLGHIPVATICFWKSPPEMSFAPAPRPHLHRKLFNVQYIR